MPGKGRLVARFGAFAFDGFEQRAFFAADVTAGADEDLQVEGQTRCPECAAREAPFAITAIDLFLQDFLGLLVLVPDVENAAGGRPSPARP